MEVEWLKKNLPSSVEGVGGFNARLELGSAGTAWPRELVLRAGPRRCEI